MWAGGTAFASVQKVHQQVLGSVDCGAAVHTWLLQGGAQAGDGALEWNLSSAQLKGRHLWALLLPRMRARFRRALPQDVKVRAARWRRRCASVVAGARDRTPGTCCGAVSRHDAPASHGSQVVRAILRDPTDRGSCVADPADSSQRDLHRPVAVLRSAFDPSAFCAAMLSREQARAQLGLAADNAPVLGAVRAPGGQQGLCLFAGCVCRRDLGVGPRRAW